MTLKDKIISRSVQEKDTGCWIWIAGTSGGYGHISVNGRVTTAQRASYLVFNGEIPEGMEIDHICVQTLCVNPEHLEAVTHRENIIRYYERRGLNVTKKQIPAFIAEMRTNNTTSPYKGGPCSRVINEAGELECTVCREMLPPERFAKAINRVCGRRSECKKCFNAKTRRRYIPGLRVYATNRMQFPSEKKRLDRI